jgi:GTP cyclohydrolase I
MASSKNGSVLSKKRAPNDATVSSPISDNLTQDGRKRRKKHELSSLGVTVNSTILSAPNEYKKPPDPVTGSGDLCKLL